MTALPTPLSGLLPLKALCLPREVAAAITVRLDYTQNHLGTEGRIMKPDRLVLSLFIVCVLLAPSQLSAEDLKRTW